MSARTLRGASVFSFVCDSEEVAEEWLCAFLKSAKQTGERSISVSDLLQNSADFVATHPDPPFSLTAIVSTPSSRDV